MSRKTDQIDECILGQLPSAKSDAVGIVDLRGRVGTIRASLKRLTEAGSAKCVWDGNTRYGRFVYWAA